MKTSPLLQILLSPPLIFPLTTAANAVTITAPPSIPSNEPSYTELSSFTSAILNSTNSYRREQSAPPVRWNDTLALFASSHLRSAACDFAHSGGPYGENLAIGYPNAAAGVEAWGDERRVYDFDDPGFGHDTGHFTQLVWRDTTDVGCGRSLCGRRGWYLVCEYWPRGNVGGQYGEEVGRQVSAAANVLLLMRANLVWTAVVVATVGALLWV